MSARPEIENLIRQVARRHDAFLARRVAVRALIATSVILIAASLYWVLRGHAVPGIVPLAAALAACVAAASVWLFKRMKADEAVRETDEFFVLKDGIASARHLSKHAPEEVATSLQWSWLSPRLAHCRVNDITEPFPKRPAMVAAALAATATWLCLLHSSPAVLAAEKEATETRQRVEQSKEELAELIDELDKEIDAPEEKDALKLDEFRKLVESIDETGNRADAARQFARIEQKIREASRSLDQQRDEETLKLAASELAKAEETEARQLGKKLDAKELKEAAEMLEKLAAKKLDPKDIKNPDTKTKTLSEAKQEIAKMRAASKRLAAAGKQRQGARQASGGQGANSQGADGEMGEGAGETSKTLEDLMAELDDAAAKAEMDLEEVEMDPDAEPGDGEAMKSANSSLDKLGKKMRGMHGKRMAKSKLDQLRQALGQAQSFTQGQSQMLGLAPGGKQAGTGSSWSERKERDDSQKNGALTQLQGQHGSGPSMSSVEETESGTGVSSRRSEAKQRELTRQVESFVQRDDVPEALKLGVRNYFENLQSAKTTE
jgi:hypothetical protein